MLQFSKRDSVERGGFVGFVVSVDIEGVVAEFSLLLGFVESDGFEDYELRLVESVLLAVELFCE
jgi:hypothetical protein